MRGVLPPVATVAIVGTRHPTPSGAAWRSRGSKQRCGCRPAVVSGLAAGVDTVAHESTLAAGGLTSAVLGSGVDVPTPVENAAHSRKGSSPRPAASSPRCRPGRRCARDNS